MKFTLHFPRQKFLSWVSMALSSILTLGVAITLYRKHVIEIGSRPALPFQKSDFERVVRDIKSKKLLIGETNGEVILPHGEQGLTQTGRVYVTQEEDGNMLVFFPTVVHMWYSEIALWFVPPSLYYDGYLYSEASLLPRIKSSQSSKYGEAVGEDIEIKGQEGSPDGVFKYTKTEDLHWYKEWRGD